MKASRYEGGATINDKINWLIFIRLVFYWRVKLELTNLTYVTLMRY